MVSAEPDEQFRSFTLSAIKDLRVRMDEMTATLDALERRVLPMAEPIDTDVLDVVKPERTIHPRKCASLPPLREWQRDALADWADAGGRARCGGSRHRIGQDSARS